ncbi:hypothetical protein JHK84_040780 [Glycine max]|nr:hypothetical protein JHK84_040780 [Glycine max]
MRTAQQPIVAAAEISNVTDFPARAESIATIVTSSSHGITYRMTLAQGLFYYGLRDTSATYVVNFLNLKLEMHTWAGRVKCGGTILCVGGALVTSIYKGKEFYLGHQSHHVQTVVTAHKTHMLRGTFILICFCFSYTAWFLVQVARHGSDHGGIILLFVGQKQ